jgi:uncharacterized RmlC-like cupin family protein
MNVIFTRAVALSSFAASKSTYTVSESYILERSVSFVGSNLILHSLVGIEDLHFFPSCLPHVNCDMSTSEVSAFASFSKIISVRYVCTVFT